MMMMMMTIIRRWEFCDSVIQAKKVIVILRNNGPNFSVVWSLIGIISYLQSHTEPIYKFETVELVSISMIITHIFFIRNTQI